MIYRGHHTYEEIAVIAAQILSPLKPWLESLRDPIRFYEQLLTDEFLASDTYRQFAAKHEYFFDAPVEQMKMNFG